MRRCEDGKLKMVIGDWWLVIGDWWLVIGDWWLGRSGKGRKMRRCEDGDWWLVIGDWWLVIGEKWEGEEDAKMWRCEDVKMWRWITSATEPKWNIPFYIFHFQFYIWTTSVVGKKRRLWTANYEQGSTWRAEGTNNTNREKWADSIMLIDW
jgi:hypothetical protein